MSSSDKLYPALNIVAPAASAPSAPPAPVTSSGDAGQKSGSWWSWSTSGAQRETVSIPLADNAATGTTATAEGTSEQVRGRGYGSSGCHGRCHGRSSYGGCRGGWRSNQQQSKERASDAQKPE
mmetsp:Transcript_10519/g.17821  ORF Transcript_10519/g.17821 Transcript_10519/m.17821 type:complete len:123 (-) Transcript_10519:342-710(-)